MNRAGMFLLLLVVNVISAATAAEKIEPDQFEVPDGFEVNVWATTPQLYNPTNFDVDAAGRIWVTEAVNYRNFRNEALGLANAEGDRVVVLEDTDGDGTADSSHTFVRDADLVAPLGIGVIGNQIVVSCAPNIIIYTDVDGDRKFDPNVDTKEIFLTGFRGLDHDHSLHSVKVGPDGFWYFNVGNGGPHTVTDKAGWTLRAGSSYAGGSPHLKENFPGRKSDDGRVWVGGVGLRIRPDGTGLTPIAHNFRNAYEESVTSFGDVFHADNDDPPACRTTWVMEYGNAGFSSADGARSWRVDQRPGQPIRVAEWRQEDPGTLPAGDVYGNGAPTGIVYGENGSFDEQYPQGLLLSCESARGEVLGYVPRPQGAGFTLERFPFMKVKSTSAQHGWFRPSDVAVGADGAIYVSDWYDAGVGGHRMTDAGGNGTIYRITPPGFKPQNPEFDLSTTAGQIAALKSPAVNVRALGLTALRDNAAEASEAILKLTRDDNAFLAARAVWLLPYAGQTGMQRLHELLEEGNADQQITAFRALRRAIQFAGDQPEWTKSFAAAQRMLAGSESSAVRREVAISLRDVPISECSEMLQQLAAGFDGWDRWYLEALGTACDGDEAEAYELLVDSAGVDPLDWDRRLAGIAWRLHPPAAVEAFKTRALSEDVPAEQRKQMINALAFIPTREAAEAMVEIATAGPDDMRGLAAWWGHNRHGNDWKEFALKEQFPEPPKVVSSKGAVRRDLDFQPVGEPVFSASGGEVQADIDVRGVKRLYLLADTISAEFTEAEWRNPTLIGPEGEVSLTELEWTSAVSGAVPVHIPKKQQNLLRRAMKAGPPTVLAEDGAAPKLQVRARSVIAWDLSAGEYERFTVTAEAVGDNPRTNNRVYFQIFVDRTPAGEELPALADLLDHSASASLGRALFFSKRLTCSNCHMAEGFGGEIGPNLTQIARKHAKPVLFEGIMNPSAAIATGFETISVLTVEGKVINGLLISAGDPVVVKDANGKIHTIPEEDVEEMFNGKTSIMPELKKLLTADEIASLVAYLQEIGQD